MDVVVRGRHCEVSERFQRHVREKLARLDKHDAKAFRVDVEIGHEANPRLSDSSERIELTLRSRGPVVRAEAAASDKYAALDMAVGKLEERLRRAADRRHGHGHGHGHGQGHADSLRTGSVGTADPLPSTTPSDSSAEPADTASPAPENDSPGEPLGDADVILAAGPLVVREKTHDATPITLEDALHHMELVGHDFYLFCDAANGAPSVVYRRRGYTYGVLRLQPQTLDGTAPAAGSAAAGR